MGFYEILILAARVCQFLFSLIVLACAGHVVSIANDYFFRGSLSISQLNFIIFVAVWSLLIVGYQILVPRFSEKLSHKFVILGLDAITALFWFAGFIALSVWTGAVSGDVPDWYRTLQAACAFGAFAWIAFMITTVLSALNIFRGNTGSAKHSHAHANPEIGHSVA